MPAQAISPPPGYVVGQTRVPLVLGFTYPLIALVVILGALRFYVRYSGRSIGRDDWFLFGAILFSLVHSIVGIWAIPKGLGRHDYDLIREGRNPRADLKPVCTYIWIHQRFIATGCYSGPRYADMDKKAFLHRPVHL